MDRFVKHLSILIIMLFILASGIDATLDRLAASPRSQPLAIYSDKNDELAIYTGNLSRFADIAKGDPRQMPKYLRRVKTPGVNPSADQGYRWL